MHCSFGVLVIAVITSSHMYFSSNSVSTHQQTELQVSSLRVQHFRSWASQKGLTIFLFLFLPFSLFSAPSWYPGSEGEPQRAAEREDCHSVPLHPVAWHGRARVRPARAHLRQEILGSQSPGHGTSGGALQVWCLWQTTQGTARAQCVPFRAT